MIGKAVVQKPIPVNKQQNETKKKMKSELTEKPKIFQI